MFSIWMKIIYFLDVKNKDEETAQDQSEKPEDEGKWRLITYQKCRISAR